jgi:flavin reductase (DIM6/NTAB) family NADH-FMN oxidoreductase RutF
MTIGAKEFWQTLGQRAVGVTIVTAQGSDGPAGFLGLSATHITANPPSMLVSIDNSTSALAAVLHRRHFAVNYLPAEAQSLADMFGGKTQAKGADRFDPVQWGALVSGAPVFKKALGVVDCTLVDTVRYESTTIALGRVVGLQHGEGKPLVFFRGQYLTL